MRIIGYEYFETHIKLIMMCKNPYNTRSSFATL